MKKVLVIFGTRPEAIKMAPIVYQLRKLPFVFETIVCVSAQHRQMLDQVLDLFAIEPDIDLNLMEENQTLSSLTERTLREVTEVIRKIAPDVVLVQGDTTTAMSAALAAFYLTIPVGHVEAGLRTGDPHNPFPEEVNRRIISLVTDYHFAPTERSGNMLLREGVRVEKVFLTGNTIVDALQIITKQLKKNSSSIVGSNGRRVILVTAHRRENFGEPLENICSALKTLVEKNPAVEIVYPVHLNPNVRSIVFRRLSGIERMHLIEPIGYFELIDMLSRCFMVLTDSGGIQEEAPSFGKPVLVLRNETERPEGVEAGVALLVGTQTDEIVRHAEHLLHSENLYRKMSGSVNPYGDGHAAERIASILNRGRIDDGLRISLAS
jgi:UDP-N-acetylglucosamine 2-epimerase (non-hydrolysing)